jgi:hypothetical protein
MMSKYERTKDTALITSAMALIAAPFGMAPLALGIGAWYIIKDVQQTKRINKSDNDKD